MAIKGLLLKHGNIGVICRQENDVEPQEKGDRRCEGRRTLISQSIEEHKGALDRMSLQKSAQKSAIHPKTRMDKVL